MDEFQFRRIWKYPLPHISSHDMRMPSGAELVHVEVQHDVITIWAIVDPAAPLADRRIEVYGTNHDIAPEHIYVGSLQHGPFVWHVFDGGES